MCVAKYILCLQNYSGIAIFLDVITVIQCFIWGEISNIVIVDMYHCILQTNCEWHVKP